MSSAGTKAPKYGYTGDYYGAVETTYKANYINASAKALTDGQKHTLDGQHLPPTPSAADASHGRTVAHLCCRPVMCCGCAASAVVGVPYGVDGVSLGGSLLAKADNVGNTAVSSYEGGLHYKSADYTASLTTTNTLGTALLTWHQVVAPSTTVAAQFEAPLQSSAPRVLHIGTSHQIDRDTVVQAKASVPTGAVSAYLEKKVGAAAQLGSALSFLPRGVLGLSLQTSAKATGGLGLTTIENYGLKYELGEF